MLEIAFPDLRQTIIPDKGYTIFDSDLSGADARVVAWEANDIDLMDAFDAGLNVHTKNAWDAFPELTAAEIEKHGDLKKSYLYDRIKRAVHATNYGGKASTVAVKCSMSIAEAEDFQALWLMSLHPAIADWHERIEYEIQTTGRTTNKFGYHIDWFSRPDDATWRKALAWGPQSTVALVAGKAQTLIERYVPNCEFLLQVHDSLVFQIPNHCLSSTLYRVKEIMDSIVVPYERQLIIPWELKMSRKSWGDCEKVAWENVI